MRPAPRESPGHMTASASAHAIEPDERLEADLLARLARGDRARPLEALYAAYGVRVYRLGLLLLRDEGAAEDLVQETFVRLWRSAGRYDPSRATVRTFVFMLARRAAVDLWRRRPRTERLVLDEALHEDVAGGEAFAALVLRLDVHEALGTLSPAHREVLVLQYDHDLTQTQTAERLGIPLGTVKSRTLHALRALAHALEERELGG
jgi:RNA polymerase sigma-70 factor, ECF subfamily